MRDFTREERAHMRGLLEEELDRNQNMGYEELDDVSRACLEALKEEAPAVVNCCRCFRPIKGKPIDDMQHFMVCNSCEKEYRAELKDEEGKL